MKQIKIIIATPDQFQDAITKGINRQLEEVRELLKKSQPNQGFSTKQISEILKVNPETIWSWVKHIM